MRSSLLPQKRFPAIQVNISRLQRDNREDQVGLGRNSHAKATTSTSSFAIRKLLPFLDPQKQDFEIRPSEYQGDGNRFLKSAFEAVGEIDFIVAGHKTANPTIEREIEGMNVLLETIPEVIAKKIIYHKPRDIFDIAAASVVHSAELIRELNPYRPNVMETVAQIDRLKSEFVRGATDSLIIRDGYKGVAFLDRAKEMLRSV